MQYEYGRVGRTEEGLFGLESDKSCLPFKKPLNDLCTGLERRLANFLRGAERRGEKRGETEGGGAKKPEQIHTTTNQPKPINHTANHETTHSNQCNLNKQQQQQQQTMQSQQQPQQQQQQQATTSTAMEQAQSLSSLLTSTIPSVNGKQRKTYPRNDGVGAF